MEADKNRLVEYAIQAPATAVLIGVAAAQKAVAATAKLVGVDNPEADLMPVAPYSRADSDKLVREKGVVHLGRFREQVVLREIDIEDGEEERNPLLRDLGHSPERLAAARRVAKRLRGRLLVPHR